MGEASGKHSTCTSNVPTAPSARRGACAEPQLRDKDARLIPAGHGGDVAGDRPVKALGIRACHSQVLLILFQAAARRSCSQRRGAVLAHSGAVPAHSPAPHGRAGPFLDLSPLIRQKPSFISSHLAG